MTAGPRLSIIPAGAVVDQRLEGRDLQVLALLGTHIDGDGWCYRSQKRMADQIGSSRPTVQRCLDRLEGAGWIERRAEIREDGGNSSNSYRVILDTGPREAPAEPPCLTGEARARPSMNGRAPARPCVGGHMNDPSLNEDERERAHEGEQTPDAELLAAFRADWPTTPVDDPVAVEGAWRMLSAEERREAVDRAAAFREALKAAKKTHVPGAVNYFGHRRWTSIAGIAERRAAAEAKSATTSCAAFGKTWCVLLVTLAARREAKRARLMVSLAEGGTSFTAKPGEIDPAMLEAAKGYPSDGEVVAAWRRWFDRRGVRLPVWRDKRVWLHLPSADPPWEEIDRDDDDDGLAG